MNLERVREVAERVARSEGLEVVDVEWKVGKQRFLRVYIDRVTSNSSSDVKSESESSPLGGISHADCEKVSQQLSVILDVEELIPGPGYILEVSSPGMDRAIRRPEEFQRFTGRLAKIWTDEPFENVKFFEGRLAGVADEKVHLQLKGKVPRTIQLPLTSIRKANLVVEF